jgi:peroxiredoxin
MTRSEEAGLSVGDAVPHFRAPSSHGQTLELESFLDKLALVLFQLPSVDHDDAVAELQQWDAHLSDFGELRIQVLGVFPDPPSSLRTVVQDHDLSITLLSDESGEIARGYAAAIDVGDGVPTVVVDRSGRVVSLVPRSGSRTHTEDVLETVRRDRIEHPGDLDPMEPRAHREAP